MPLINTALTLKDLPPPPPGRTGWPWTEQTEPLPERMPDGSEWPRISIVTPSYNQGEFIEETLRSVLLQGYPNLEYIIIDGGSADNSVEIIKKYEQYLAYWVSEPDRGQSHGINKGLQECTGDYIAWMNSSDCYMLNAFQDIFLKLGKTHPDFIFSYAAYGGKSLENIRVNYSLGIKSFSLKYLLRFFYSQVYIIPSQSVFVSKALFQKVGFLNEDLHYCMDLEWYVKMALENPSVYTTQKPICFYRYHDDAKTALSGRNLKEEAIMIAQKYVDYLSKSEREKLSRLIQYTKVMESYISDRLEKSTVNLLRIFLQFPIKVLTDRRMLRILRKNWSNIFLRLPI